MNICESDSARLANQGTDVVPSSDGHECARRLPRDNVATLHPFGVFRYTYLLVGELRGSESRHSGEGREVRCGLLGGLEFRCRGRIGSRGRQAAGAGGGGGTADEGAGGCRYEHGRRGGGQSEVVRCDGEDAPFAADARTAVAWTLEKRYPERVR